MEGHLDIGFGTNFDKNDNVAIIALWISICMIYPSRARCGVGVEITFRQVQ